MIKYQISVNAQGPTEKRLNGRQFDHLPQIDPGYASSYIVALTFAILFQSRSFNEPIISDINFPHSILHLQ